MEERVYRISQISSFLRYGLFYLTIQKYATENMEGITSPKDMTTMHLRSSDMIIVPFLSQSWIWLLTKSVIINRFTILTPFP